MKKPKLEGVKNLLFDLGGVIMDIRRENCVKALEQLEVSGIGEMLGVYCQQGAFLQLEEGKITPAEFRDYVRGKSARTLSDEEIDTMYDRGEAITWSAAELAKKRLLKEWGFFWDPERQCKRLGLE